MPKRKRTYKRKRATGKKRKFVKSRRKRRSTMTSIGKSNPFPKQFSTSLRYEAVVQLDAGLGSVSHLFRAGSVFDPDFTSVGHQPRYFDQIMPSYDHFTVIGSKILIKAVNTNNEAMVVGVQLNGNGTTVSSINNLIENRNSVYKWLGHQYSNTSIGTISMKYSPKKFLGITKPMASENLRGSISSNPTEDAYFAVTVGAHDNSVNPGNITLRVIIDYITVFTEPRTVTQS